MSKPTDLVQGTLDLLIMKVVGLEPMHGWAIAQRIQQMSSEVLQVGQSALYPALHKLEQQGWVEAEWKISETNRRAKYYSLTSAGRKAHWKDIGIKYPSGRVTKTVVAGSEPRSRVQLEMSAPAQWSLDAERDAQILSRVLQIRRG